MLSKPDSEVVDQKLAPSCSLKYQSKLSIWLHFVVLIESHLDAQQTNSEVGLLIKRSLLGAAFGMTKFITVIV